MKLEEVLKNLEVAFGKEAIKYLELEYGITPGTEPELAEQPVFTLTKSVSIAEPSPSVILPKSTFQHQEPPACRFHSSKQGRSEKQIKKDRKRKKRR